MTAPLLEDDPLLEDELDELLLLELLELDDELLDNDPPLLLELLELLDDETPLDELLAATVTVAGTMADEGGSDANCGECFDGSTGWAFREEHNPLDTPWKSQQRTHRSHASRGRRP